VGMAARLVPNCITGWQSHGNQQHKVTLTMSVIRSIHCNNNNNKLLLLLLLHTNQSYQ
jgi:hypothetical protein